MIIEKLIIFDMKNEVANDFKFSPTANIIHSKGSTCGKSCLIKSIYYGLGLKLSNFASGWNYKDMAIKLFYSLGETKGTILRYKGSFWIDNNQQLSERDYSEWLSGLLNFKIKLQIKDNDSLENVIASVILCLFYIDQDTSWAKVPYRNTVNLGWYKADAIPKTIFEYAFGIKSSLNIDITEEISKLNKQISIINKQLEVLNDLRDNFISKDVVSDFDETKIKKEIKMYLDYADRLQESVRAYKSKIYSEQIKMNTYEAELSELKDILDYSQKSYKSLSATCTKCNSPLTNEHSVSERIRISNNILDIQSDISEFETKTKKSKIKIQEFLTEKINIETEYKKLVSLAQVKQGELTLEQHMQLKSQSFARSKYYDVKSKLCQQQDDLASILKGKVAESKKLEKNQQERRKKIEQSFNKMLADNAIRFSNVDLNNKFLDFKQLSGSGADKNQKFLLFYMIYTNLLLQYSTIHLPFVLDSIVKDELDENVLSKSYKLVEDVLLSSDRQSFFAILSDKLQFFNHNEYHKIEISCSQRLLSQEKYRKLKSELPHMR